MRLVLALLFVPALAHADSLTSSATPSDAIDHHFAVAVNEPFGWIHGAALGFSGYAAITNHQVIRVNVASWSHGYSDSFENAGEFLLSGGDGSASGSGRYTDVGAGWMYFPRRAFDGPSLEAGAVVRRRSTWDWTKNDDFADDTTTVDSTMIGTRALIGWSWLMYDRAFISLQAGLSVGREFGSQVQTLTDEHMMPVASNLDQTTISGEAFMRFGVLL